MKLRTFKHGSTEGQETKEFNGEKLRFYGGIVPNDSKNKVYIQIDDFHSKIHHLDGDLLASLRIHNVKELLWLYERLGQIVEKVKEIDK